MGEEENKQTLLHKALQHVQLLSECAIFLSISLLLNRSAIILQWTTNVPTSWIETGDQFLNICPVGLVILQNEFLQWKTKLSSVSDEVVCAAEDPCKQCSCKFGPGVHRKPQSDPPVIQLQAQEVVVEVTFTTVRGTCGTIGSFTFWA